MPPTRSGSRSGSGLAPRERGLELGDRLADVGLDPSVQAFGGWQVLGHRGEGRADATNERLQLGGLPVGGVQGRGDRAAGLVSQDQDDLHPQVQGSELDAADLVVGQDVARHPDHEEVAQAVIEQELGRHPGVRAAEDGRKGVLPFRVEHRHASERLVVMPRLPLGEAAVAGEEPGERLLPGRGLQVPVLAHAGLGVLPRTGARGRRRTGWEPGEEQADEQEAGGRHAADLVG
jgi:hypothetical protein